MKLLLLSFSLALLNTNSFSQQKNDSTTIVNLIIADYKTLGTWDIKSHTANCTDNYMLIENGDIQTLTDETEYFKRNAHRVIDRKDYFDFKNVRITGDVAYTVYMLRSDITEAGKLKSWMWVETTVVRKIKGEWKIELIHSTKVLTEK